MPENAASSAKQTQKSAEELKLIDDRIKLGGSLSASLQAGSLIAHRLGNPALGNKLNTLGVGVASITAGYAAFSAGGALGFTLGPVGMVLGTVLCGLGLFGGDDSGGNKMGEYLDARFNQILHGLHEIRVDIFNLAEENREQFAFLVKLIVGFEANFTEISSKLLQRTDVLEKLTEQARREIAAGFYTVTMEHGVQTLLDYFSQFKKEFNEYNEQNNSFMMEAQGTGVHSTQTHDVLVKLYKKINSHLIESGGTEKLRDDGNPPIKTMQDHLVYLSEYREDLDIAWLCRHTDTLLFEDLPHIQLPADNYFMHRKLLIKRAEILTQSLDIRYSSTDDKMPEDAYRSVHTLYENFLKPYLELLKTLKEKNTLQHIKGLYVGLVTNSLKEFIQRKLAEFEKKQTEIHREQQDSRDAQSIAVFDKIKAEIKEQELGVKKIRMPSECLAAEWREISMFHEFRISEENKHLFIADNKHVNLGLHAAQGFVGYDHTRYHQISLTNEYLTQLDQYKIAQTTGVQAKKAAINVRLFPALLESYPELTLLMMTPDEETKKQSSCTQLILPVPRAIIKLIPNEIQALVYGGIGELQCEYAINPENVNAIRISVKVNLKYPTSLTSKTCIDVLQATITKPPQYEKYSIGEQWLLFFLGGHWAHGTVAFKYKMLELGQDRGASKTYIVANFKHDPYPSFLISEDGQFEGVQCVTLVSGFAELFKAAINKPLLEQYQSYNQLHEAFKEEIKQSFARLGDRELLLDHINNVFFTLLALLELIQPKVQSETETIKHYVDMIEALKVQHEIIIDAVQHGVEGLAKIDAALEEMTAIFNRISADPLTRPDHPLLQTTEILETFLSKWENKRTTESSVCSGPIPDLSFLEGMPNPGGAMFLMLQVLIKDRASLQASLTRVSKQIGHLESLIHEQASQSKANVNDQYCEEKAIADSLYAKGRASYHCQKLQEAMRFFSEARTKYKALLENPAYKALLQNPAHKPHELKIGNRVEKTSKPEKFSEEALGRAYASHPA